MKKIMLFFSILFFCYFCTNHPVLFANETNDNEIQLIVNGQRLEGLLTPPVIQNDLTLVPARDVFEELGAHVDWDEASRHIYVAYRYSFIVLQIDNSVAFINNAPVLMDISPQIMNGRTMIPLRFVAESLGFWVDWDGELRAVFIDTYIFHEPTAEDPPLPVDNDFESNLIGIVPARDISPAPLVNMPFPQMYVVGIDIIDEFRQAIDITTSSEISEVRTTLLPDNRLIIDFHNAVMGTDATEFVPSVISAFARVRIAQFEVTPVKITRVVVELQSGVLYSITMSGDRKTLSIDFERNHIQNIAHHSSAAADYITITGARAPIITITHFSAPDRLVVEIPFSSTAPWEAHMHSRFIRHANAWQFDTDTVRITLELSDRVSFSVDSVDNSTTIRVTEATHRNIYFDNANNVLRLARSHFAPLNMHGLTRNDLYWNRQIVFTLPGDFSSVYGFGRFYINDENMYFFNIETMNGITRITVNSRRIFTVVISEDSNYIYISFRHPRDVYGRIVVIDPGHGGSDPGTTSIGGIHERYLVLDVSLKLLEMFNNSNVRVYMTRRSDITVSRPARAALANEVGADLFISVHMNSAAPNRVPSGTETHYFPDAEIMGGGFCSAQMATIFQRHVQSALGTNDRGVVRGSWDVLTLTRMPAVLSELGFLSNPYEAERLKNPAVQQMTAAALFSATMEVFNNHNLR